MSFDVFLIKTMTKIDHINEKAKSPCEQRCSHNIWYFLFFLLVFFPGFRDPYIVGIDSENYWEFFVSVQDIDIWDSNFEIGYTLLNQILSQVFDNQYAYSIFFPVALISVGLCLRFFKKYSVSLLFSVILFILMRFYDLHFSAMRQVIAIGFILLSYDYIIRKKIVCYLLTILIAASFHKSAIIFAPFYLINYIKLPKLTAKTSAIMFIIILLCLQPLKWIIFTFLSNVSWFNSYLLYFENDYFSSGIGTVFIFLLTMAVFLIATFYSKCPNCSEMKIREQHIFSYAVFVGIVILEISIVVAQLERIAQYFLQPLCIIVVNSLLSNKKYMVLLSVIIVLLISYITIHYLKDGWVKIYPYSLSLKRS